MAARVMRKASADFSWPVTTTAELGTCAQAETMSHGEGLAANAGPALQQCLEAAKATPSTQDLCALLMKVEMRVQAAT